MKKFFFLMAALVVVLTSCQEKYSCEIAVSSNNVYGWVRFNIPVSISQENMSELKTDLVKVAEVSRSPEELKSLVRYKIRSVGGSGISFEFTTNGMTVSRNVENYYVVVGVLVGLILFFRAAYGREWLQELLQELQDLVGW